MGKRQFTKNTDRRPGEQKMGEIISCHQWARCDCILLLALMLTLGSPALVTSMPTARTSTVMVCPQYYYHDHGTDNCEFCCDICCNAELKRTTADCEAHCADYAQKLRDEAAQQIQDDAQKLMNNNPHSPASSPTATVQPAAQTAIPVATTLLLLLLLGLIVVKRTAIVAKFRRSQVPAPGAEDPAAGELLDLEPREQDGPSDPPAQNPLLPTSTGIQESRETPAGEGNSWHTLSHYQSAVMTSGRGGGGGGAGEAKKPVEVSLEGHLGPCELVLPMRDTTERKTVVPSVLLSESCV